MATIVDTDKGGQGFQKQRVWLGPSLGWSEEYVQPSTKITTAIHNVQPGEGILLVDAGGPVTINLPDVRSWWQQPADQPATAWNRQICIKDWAGTASSFNITVVPFGAQTIDKFIGPTALTVDNSVFLLVPNVDLSGWIIAAGTTSVLIPVGTFLPVHNPNATGKLTVREPGGNIAALQGSSITQQAVILSADAASVDDDVNIHIVPKNAGGVLLYSNNALQAQISGPAAPSDYLVFSGGANPLSPPVITSFNGGPVAVRDTLVVGVESANQAFITGSAVGQQTVIYGVWPNSSDADVNIDLRPKNAGGILMYSHGALQAQVSGPADTNDYLVITGSTSLDDPLIATASGGPIRLHGSILVGPAGGNFAGLQGSPPGGQFVSLRADNVESPDADINIAIIPKAGGSTIIFATGSPQVIIGGPADTVQTITLQGAQAGGNSRIQTAPLGGVIDIVNANLLGDPHAVTPPLGDNDTSIATTEWIHQNEYVQVVGPVVGLWSDKLAGFTDVGTQIQPIAMPAAGLARVGPVLALRNDLEALEALTGTNNIYYRSGVDTWSSVTIGGGLSFTGGTLSASGGGGDVFKTGNNTFTGSNFFTGPATVIGYTAAIDAVAYKTEIHAAAAPVNFGLFNWSTATTSGLNLFRSKSGTIGTHTAVASADILGQMSFRGSDGTAFVNSASIIATVDGAVAAGSVPGKLTFNTTAPGLGAVQQRLEIDASGRVTVGLQRTASATTFFNVIGVNGSQAAMTLEDYQNAAGAANINLAHSRGTIGTHAPLQANDPIGQIRFHGSDGTGFVECARIEGMATAAASAGNQPTALKFLTMPTGGVLQEQWRINQLGGLQAVGVTGAAEPGQGAITMRAAIMRQLSDAPGQGAIWYNTAASNQVYAYALGDILWFNGSSSLTSFNWAIGGDVANPIMLARAGGVAIKGTNSNDNAAIGFVGEYLEAVRTTNLGLTSGTATEVVSISLTAGDWEIAASANYGLTGAVTLVELEITSTGITMTGNPRYYKITTSTTSANFAMSAPTSRVTILGGPTTVRLCTRVNVTGGNVASAVITARRVR